ncbi:PhoD-like phosphatase-domain-containing protein [Pseudoneurospora amorphoporcata]|uniref:PhoD-like phosphatase-domain-containing protein n=1 Tax=Pseudoneurospora amorphoporcata TaxID=241081 RepID=A0AAN6SCG8_9PEZI|nr:PhoD-like phosphatase-domain-containing protein [Pseudoneurospora amorphoporcata]
MYSLLGLAALFPLASASFEGNLNYRAPSARSDHVNLGLSLPIITARTLKRSSVAYQPSELNFTHGVASGDPYPNSVILWTRVAPTAESDKSDVTVSGTVDLYSHETEKYIQADANPICVEWNVWEVEKGHKGQPKSSGKAYTTSDIDFTVKVEAQGLKPWTLYNYQFNVCGSNNTSPVGRTKTAPAEHADVDEVKLAVFSCSNYPKGFFNVYGNAARKDQHDFVIHLGDYFYEDASGGPRAHKPANKLFTLYDYRTRHGQYRTDNDLQLLAQNFAWIPTWDDHEFANNGYRDGFSALNNTEASFRNDGPSISVDTRKVHAVRAYFEWMPIRQVDLDDNLRIWRSFKMGKLMDLIMIDTRNYDRSITSGGNNNAYIEAIRDDPSRTLMGGRQEKWFFRQLSESKERAATWRVVGNQIVFSRILDAEGALTGTDNWSGYVASRNRTLQHLYDNGITDNIFLSGDSHQNWVSDLAWLGTKPYDGTTGSGAIGVEFAGTGVTSSGPKGNIATIQKGTKTKVDSNPELQWQEGYYRGYFHLSIQKSKIDAQFFGSPSVATRNGWDLPLANFTVLAGDNHLQRPVGGGKVEAGTLKGGETVGTNVTLDTNAWKWQKVGFEKMYVK